MPTKTQSLPHGSSKGSGNIVPQSGTTATKPTKTSQFPTTSSGKVTCPGKTTPLLFAELFAGTASTVKRKTSDESQKASTVTLHVPKKTSTDIGKHSGTARIGIQSTSTAIGKIIPKTKVKAGTTKTSQSSSGKSTPQQFAGTNSTSVKRKASTGTVSKAAAIYDTLLQKRNKLYCLFLQYSIPLFNRVNVELQSESPKFHVLLDILQQLLRDIQLRFVKPAILLKATMPEKCEYAKHENQREDEDLIVGVKVRDFLSSEQLTDQEKTRVFFFSKEVLCSFL